MFSIEQVGETTTPFRLKEVLYDIRFENIERSFEEALDLVKNMILELVESLQSKMGDGDKIALTFYHSMLDQPIAIPFVKKRLFTFELVMDYILHVTQSYKDLQINPNNSLNATVQIQSLPLGGGRRALPESEKKKYVKKPKKMTKKELAFIEWQNKPAKSREPEKPKTRVKHLKEPYNYIKKADRPETLSHVQLMIQKNTRSTIQIKNKDNYCALRSILMAKYKHDEKYDLINEKQIPSKTKLNALIKQIAKN